MNRLRLPLVTALFLIHVGVALCGPLPAPRPGDKLRPYVWGASVQDLQIGACLEKPIVEVGQPVMIDLAVRSTGGSVIAVLVSGAEFDYDIAIADASGKPVLLAGRGHYISGQKGPGAHRHAYMFQAENLAPGGITQCNFDLTRLYDLPVGAYEVRVSRDGAFPPSATAEAASKVRMETGPVRLQIVEKQPQP